VAHPAVVLRLMRSKSTPFIKSASHYTDFLTHRLSRRRGVRHAKASSWFYEGTPSTTVSVSSLCRLAALGVLSVGVFRDAACSISARVKRTSFTMKHS
jgi:hypothetical protein